MDEVNLSFEDDALDYIVDKAIEFKLGARGLRSICEAVMVDAMFDFPSQKEKQDFVVSLQFAKEKIEASKLQKLKVA